MKPFFAALVTTLLLDGLFLGVLAKKFLLAQVGHLMRRSADGSLDPAWGGAALVYLLIPLGLTLFVLPRAESFGSAIAWGFVFGLVLYGVYEGTNYSLLKGWPLPMLVVDFFWGGVLCALASAAAFFASTRF